MRCLPAVVIVCVASAVAHAADPKLEAKRLIGEGDALFKKGDYEGALAAYQKAYEAFQSPKIFFPMAQAEEKLGRDLEALTHYEQLLADSGDQLPQSVRTEAQGRIEEIEKRIAVVTFDVEPAGATISVDDVELGAAPLEKATRLMPGKHKVTVAAEERKTKEIPLDLKAGDRPVINVKLESSHPKIAVGRGAGEGRAARPIDTNESSGRGVLYTSMFVAGAATIGATITGIMAIQKHAIFVDPMKTPMERAAAQSKGKDLAFDTDLMIFAAAAAGTFTVIWYYSAVKPRAARRHASHPIEHKPDEVPGAPPPPGGDTDDDSPLGMILTPWASADAGGLAVFGRF